MTSTPEGSADGNRDYLSNLKLKAEMRQFPRSTAVVSRRPAKIPQIPPHRDTQGRVRVAGG